MVRDAEDQGASLLAAAAAATAGAVAKAAEFAAAKGSDATEPEGIGVEAAEAVVAAKQQAAVSVAALAEDGGMTGGPAPGSAATGAAVNGPPSLRLFVRGSGSLGEHHLRDYFHKFGEVLEASLVRDKKTQRPRGMAFVTLQPRGEGGSSCASLADEIAGEIHTVNGVEVEVQEALPKPEKEEKETGSASQGGAPPLAQEGQALPGGAVAAAGLQQEDEAAEPAPATTQALAQAQWQMHYLAMAINASVPEVPGPHEGPPFKKAAPARPPASLAGPAGLHGAGARR